MKFFVIACLIAVAVAEPTADAEADPALLYRNAYAYGNAYSPYAAGYAGYAGAYAAPAYAGYSAYAAPAYRGYAAAAYSPYNYGAYSNAFGYRSFGKRDADAEPTAEADPALLYGSNYAYGAYSPYAAAAYRPYAAAYSTAYAAPAYAGYSAYAAPAYAGYGTYGAYAGAYANAGRYYANSGGAVHIAKRDAEAEPTAEADPALLYGSNYAYGAYRSPYAYAGYNAYRPAYASAYRTPYAYAGYSGYNAYNGVYGYGK